MSGSNGHSDDRVLLQRALTGDAEAVAELYRRHRRKLCNHLSRRGATSHRDREDVTQLVFLRLLRRGSESDPAEIQIGDDGFSNDAFPYLARMANCLFLDRRRRKRARERRESATFWPDVCGGPLVSVLQHERNKILRAAVEDLTPEQRRAIKLVYFQGMTAPQAAEAADCSVDAMKSCCRRARQRLAKVLTEQR